VPLGPRIPRPVLRLFELETRLALLKVFLVKTEVLQTFQCHQARFEGDDGHFLVLQLFEFTLMGEIFLGSNWGNAKFFILREEVLLNLIFQFGQWKKFKLGFTFRAEVLSGRNFFGFNARFVCCRTRTGGLP
jgi:hypothetical protein